ncbi:putative ESA1-histone acetyltransferase [Calocera viscosa TUFC12733]|uniref:histone acetyltransferase n=1 Tax=Calocera viscosa (strain TUFC12733) TaxID=1330018 RepID=A0A167IZH3_CALVF|nr:putative ESA1-histone acetyltransferase [Calocera viscosa TUFC12733]
MVHGASQSNEDDTPAQISMAGTWTLSDVVPGCKVWVHRPMGGKGGQMTTLHAEVISIRDKPQPNVPHAHGTGLSLSTNGDEKVEEHEYYVHYDQWNKRLDEWIPTTRVLLDQELTWPKPPKKEQPKRAAEKKLPKKAGRASSSSQVQTPTGDGTATPVGVKRKHEDEEDTSAEASGMATPTNELEHSRNAGLSKAQEIEQLRTSGSMSHQHEARVKNLVKIEIGRHIIEPWYFSPYPKEFSYTPVLYICEFCLRYWASETQFRRHRTKCTLRHPPGNEIYREKEISFFEIDGRRQKQWCRNLCLLSKCFLDHKTLYFDVDPFLFYCMVKRDQYGCHLVGYFSKEKECGEGYNVACILTLPQYQRHGYGRLLMEFSYELTKRENKVGSPEKPLSDLGLLGYKAYWKEIIVDFVLNIYRTGGKEADISVDEISQKTGILQTDVMTALHELQLLKWYKGQHVIVLGDEVLARHEKTVAKQRRRIDPTRLQWKPPVFSRAQLSFGW